METKHKCVISHICTDTSRISVAVSTEKHLTVGWEGQSCFSSSDFLFSLKKKMLSGFLPLSLKSELFLSCVWILMECQTPWQDLWWL